jgi:hypothetical protein
MNSSKPESFILINSVSISNDFKSSEYSKFDAELANVTDAPSCLKRAINCIILDPAAEESGSGHTVPIISTL